jgi:hypothetical protein
VVHEVVGSTCQGTAYADGKQRPSSLANATQLSIRGDARICSAIDMQTAGEVGVPGNSPGIDEIGARDRAVDRAPN